MTQKSKHRYTIIKHPITGEQIAIHRYVMECYLGRPLQAEEIVHHINENPDDNHLSNLSVLSHNEHRHAHGAAKILAAGGDPHIHKLCTLCKELRKRSEFYANLRSGDGLSGVCKLCRAKMQTILKKEIKPLSKKRKNWKKYQQTERYRAYQREYAKTYNQSDTFKKNKEKYKATKREKDKLRYALLKEHLDTAEKPVPRNTFKRKQKD